MSTMSKLVLKRYLMYKLAAQQHAFPRGSTLHGVCTERCVYLWKARPPSHKSWHKDHGITGFFQDDTLPNYLTERVSIFVGWNDASPAVPWETEEETQLRVEEADQFSQSAIASKALSHASLKRLPVGEIDLTDSAAAGSLTSGDMWDVDGGGKRARFQEIIHLPPAAPHSIRPATSVDPFPIRAPPASKGGLLQYAPAPIRVGTGQLPFGRPISIPSPIETFNPFQPSSAHANPKYTTMYSPEKQNPYSLVVCDANSDARRSLCTLLEPSAHTSATTDWTFMDIHHGSKNVRAQAKLSCLLVIHDFQWQGVVHDNQAVPEEWKLFPGPLFFQFRDQFFGSASATKDAIDWLRSEYRQDLQTRLADRRLRPAIEDAFWIKDVFEDFRTGNWGFNHPIQQADVDSHFTIFSFILSVVKSAQWPPRLPPDGLSIGAMMQLSRNVLWFFDLVLAQPGQSGSLFLDFSLLGQALLHQFEYLDQRELGDQWDASPASRHSHSFYFLLATHRLLCEMHRC
jgi:hypothetical protein